MDERSRVKLKVRLAPTADDRHVTFIPTGITISANHSFGRDAQYKLRNPQVNGEYEVMGLRLVVELPPEDSPQPSLADVLVALVGEHMVALEDVVLDAMEREEWQMQKDVSRIKNPEAQDL